MKNEKEIKQKIYYLKMLATSTCEEEYIKQTQIDMLEWVINDQPKFKIGDNVVYYKGTCAFLGIISMVAENNRYFVKFKNCIINELCLDESILELKENRDYNFKNIK
jgi:hypothetical protein